MTLGSEIDFVKIVKIFYNKKSIILLSIFVFIFFGLYNLSNTSYQYRVQLQVFPVKDDNTLNLVEKFVSLSSVLRGVPASTNMG